MEANSFREILFASAKGCMEDFWISDLPISHLACPELPGKIQIDGRDVRVTSASDRGSPRCLNGSFLTEYAPLYFYSCLDA